ncbi:hypothetical protein [Mycobacterium lepromatosis]|uniref:hypothetical protein n=1 Tax=Mycobacterium lepromatosis TaxID=480418 RepID=UPI002351CF33|nr:hypothetical protein [Mycobacterium lepromatosis]
MGNEIGCATKLSKLSSLLAGLRGDVEHGAVLVVATIVDGMARPSTDIEGWTAGVDALLVECVSAGRCLACTLPS